MSTRFALCAGLLLVLAGGCAGTQTSSPTTVRVAPRTVLAVVSRLESDYANADWTDVQRQFASRAIGDKLVQRMQQWKDYSVPRVKAVLADERAAGKNRWIGTIQFTDDPRAIPEYAIFVFARSGGRTRIVGTTSGLTGTNLTNANWRITRTQHFTIYHSRYQLEGTDGTFAATLEFERNAFIRKFGVAVASHIAYYLYPTVPLMAHFTRKVCGAESGEVACADPYTRPPSIQSSEWPTYHEPIHVYELSLEPPVHPGQPVYVAPLFIGEGTAVALEDRQVDPRLSDYCSNLRYVPLDTCARQALSDVRPLSLLSDAGFKRADPGDAYSLGGSFVKYLLLRYGYQRFGRFYNVLAAQPKDRVLDYNVAARRVYGASITGLLESWTHGLSGG